METNYSAERDGVGSERAVAEETVRMHQLLDPGSEVGRSFATLVKNLDALGRPAKSVVVTGPEPGVGRTTVCLGLGATLAAAGRKVTLVDCNLDQPHLHRPFGRPNFTGLTSVLEGSGSLENYGFEAAPNLRVIPTGPVLPGLPGSWVLPNSPKLVEAIRDLGESRDVVLLDAPVASEVLDAPSFWGSFDGVLLVVHATRTPKGVARGFTDALLDARINLFGVVLNGHV
ncbi:MAG TPA: CpsD/CapB family tyrosine-protein kinase [Rubrobacteraceae bacterium]|jgi:Mrp family chromosome partitioning ATPase|nr:CpsD/CapB family tyrosine-protein kinase [Rubrobacteraceae bacterium]